MTYKKAVEVMMQLKAEYFYAFKDMPDELFKIRIKNFMKMLEDYSEKEIDIALGVVLKENKTLPTTASFVEILERNKELLLPSAEEEWANIKEVIAEMQVRSIRFNVGTSSTEEYERHKQRQRESYNKLSQAVKDYYVNYSGFLEIVYAEKLDIEKNKFIKNFPDFRKRKRQQKELYKQLEIEECVKKS